MFQVEIKTNGIISCVSTFNANTKKEAIAEVKAANPKSKYLRCWVGNPSVIKSPVGPPLDTIIAKLSSNKKQSIASEASYELC